MPAVSLLESSVAVPSHPTDGIDLVNGFYGPGAWSSWVIAVAWSWISIFNGQRQLSYDFIAHLLYTSWAAIDLLRQLKGEATSISALTAAMVATFWGIVNDLVQYIYIIGVSPEGDRQPRTILLAAGGTTMLASAAFLACTIHLFSHGQSILGHFRFIHNKDMLLMDEFSTAMLNAALIGFAAFSLPFGFAVADGWMKSLKSCASYISFFLGVALPVFFVIGYGSVLLGIFRDAEVPEPDCSFLKPCSGQRLADWDQAFALLCALAIIVREVGTNVWSNIRFPGATSNAFGEGV